MSPTSSVKTLKIDGQDLSGRQEETILDVARQNGIFLPRLCEMDGLSDVGACRLCLVEVKGQNRLLPACVTRGRRGHGSHYEFGSPTKIPQDDPGAAVRRAQSHLLGLRFERSL